MKEAVACSFSECKEPVAFWFPAFDWTIKPAPYCAGHYETVKRTMVLEGPRLIPQKKLPALVTA